MKTIPLTQGKIAVVDDCDFADLNKYRWFARESHGVWYAFRHAPRESDGRQTSVQMHRQIFPGVAQIDHRDNDGLNNIRKNLRPATQTQNNANQRKRKNCSSVYKGVYWDKQLSHWRAQITASHGIFSLGLFKEETDAARAYDSAARFFFGEFAKLNFP